MDEENHQGAQDKNLNEDPNLTYSARKMVWTTGYTSLDLPEHQRVRITIHEPIGESPDETLEAWHQVYEGCAEEEIAQIEAIALDRSRFMRQEP